MGNSAKVAIAILFVLVSGYGCGGGCGGCSGMTPIPGGFPSAKRHPNAGQVRVTSTALTTLEADPAGLVSSFLGGGPLTFAVPSSCGGSPAAICCPGGTPQPNCGPINIDLGVHPGDQGKRLELVPKPSGNVNGELDVTVRAELKTTMDLPIDAFGLTCGIKIDTTKGTTYKDIEIVVPVMLTQDGVTGTTGILSGDVKVNRLETEDVAITGNILCQGINLGAGFLTGFLTTTIQDQIKSQLSTAGCKTCPSGNVAECGSPFAVSCDTNMRCLEADAKTCVQETGIAGRMPAVSLFAGFSPGTTGALDLYEVIGGYSTTNNTGASLGMLGGMEPAGAPRDRCGPPATEPSSAAIPQSVFFQGNTRPDTGDKFDIGIGIHKSQLAQFAFAGYDGGLLCLTVGKRVSNMLNTDTIGLLSRSLTKLVDTSSPVAVGLRPQSPPEIVLGKNTFVDDGMGNMSVGEPLLDLTFKAMEIDFFAAVDDQYIRVFTVVSDVHLPIGLQVTAAGQLSPVLGDTAMAFTNVSVKNSEAVTESPADLANLFPSLLGLVLPQLSGALPSISLPALGPLNLKVQSITAVPTTVGGTTNDFLAIYTNLATAPVAIAPVETRATLTAIDEPDAAIMNSPRRWTGQRPPAVTLELGTASRAAVEYSLRTDHGAWSAWSTNEKPTIAPRTFWLQGTHTVEVRARELDTPETIDPTPEVLTFDIGVPANQIAPFHGAPGQAGCGCATSRPDAGSLAGAVLVFGMIVLPIGRLRRRARRAVKRAMKLGPIIWIAAVACLPGCSCSSNPCGDATCLPGDVDHGALGKFTSIAGDADRVMVATYDKGLGDLVAVDATDPTNLVLVAVDGFAVDGAVPTHDPAGYRGGIEDAGPDVGAHTSIAMANGLARIAYQDRDNKALKFAYEAKGGKWTSYTVDPGTGEAVGEMISMTVDSTGTPIIAYLAVGNDDGTGHRQTELRVARGTMQTPHASSDWSTHVVATGAGTCAGLCEGTTCATATTGEQCVTPTTDCTTACSSTQVCSAGTCLAKVADPITSDLPTGNGLFPNALVLGDGRVAIVYYDRNNRALVIAVEGSAGSGTYTPTTLDTVTPGDRGMWADAIVDPANSTVHVAYQEALGDQLLYTTWTNGTISPPEVVDDGERPGDRTHPVGAAAAIYLVNGTPTIAYQDGLVSDVDVATRAGATWTMTPLATGPLLDGFSIGATTAHGSKPYLAWEQFVPANVPPGGLIVQTH